MPQVTPTIACDFSGGNIILQRSDGDEFYIRQDQRGSTERWFYWQFEVRGAAGRTLTFHFTDWDVIGTRGPAVSINGGRTWRWLGRGCVDGSSFQYQFGEAEDDTRFCFCIPYTHAELFDFLAEYQALSREIHCTTPAGRDVERLHLGDPDAGRCLMLTARHHCCEAAGSYVLEGLLAALIDDPLDDVAVAAVPFMDADGVEAGDQGKKRNDHDHNRDYVGPGVYAETTALRRWFPGWKSGRPTVALDLHCPWIRGEWNEKIYLVGSRHPHIAPEQRRFMQLLADTADGPLPVRAGDYLPFGQAWNVGREPVESKKGCSTWMAEQIDVRLAGTLEIPYAAVREVDVTVQALRAFGRDLAEAIGVYFDQLT